MPAPDVFLLALLVLLACATVAGGVYEYVVIDPAWPTCPAIIQPAQGGVSRRRFWIPIHSAFEVVLVVAVIVTWSVPDVRDALFVAFISHTVMRVWSLAEFVPKAVAFENADPAAIDADAAVRWTRRSLLRLPLDGVTVAAAFVALLMAVS